MRWIFPDAIFINMILQSNSEQSLKYKTHRHVWQYSRNNKKQQQQNMSKLNQMTAIIEGKPSKSTSADVCLRLL